MTRRSLAVCMVLAALLAAPGAGAQYSEASDAAPSASAPPPPAPAPSPASAPSASASASSAGAPVRGPAMRERTSRRSRAGSTASGVLFIVILVAAMGWYVIKRLRR
ncbi:MAG: hypothetical protein KF819_12205 [Labilithrix sp.]|nr:hypothetical protein [Labilithrix sp.]